MRQGKFFLKAVALGLGIALSLTACGDTGSSDDKQVSAENEKQEKMSSKKEDWEIKSGEEQTQDAGGDDTQTQDAKDNGAQKDDRINQFVGVKYYLSSDMGFEVIDADTDGIKLLSVWGLENGAPAKYEYDLTPNGFQSWLGKIVLGCKDDDFEVTFYFDEKANFCEVIVKGPEDPAGAEHKGLGFLQTEKYTTDMPAASEPAVTQKENKWEIETMEPTKMIVSGSPAVKTAPSLEADKVKVNFDAGSEVVVIGHVSEYNGSKCDYYLIQGNTEMYVQGYFLKKAENSD